jgi:hypothetical protein
MQAKPQEHKSKLYRQPIADERPLKAASPSNSLVPSKSAAV